MNPRKSPGINGFTGTIERKAWPLMEGHVCEIFNEAPQWGYFSKVWKTADVVTILRSEDKNSSLPKSYRSVSLLPVMGKVLEHLVCTRLQQEVNQNIAED